MNGRWVRRLLAACLVLSGCGASADVGVDVDEEASSATGEVGASPPAATTALLGVLEPGVTVADEPPDPVAATFRTGQDGESLVVSDVVRTDAAGFAEVQWLTGALARLDVDSSLVVTALDARPDQAEVTLDLDSGRVWNRLRGDGEVRYEVTTDVATAAVRGTAFWVGCAPTGCTFAVFEGTVAVQPRDGPEILLGPGDELTVMADGTVGAVVWSDLGEPWVTRNAALDEQAGFPALPVQDRPPSTCPFGAPPDGWELQAPDEDGYCSLRFADAGPATFALVERLGPAPVAAATVLDPARADHEEVVAQVVASPCAEGRLELTAEYADEPLGWGRLRGFVGEIWSGPVTETSASCFARESFNYQMVIDGQAWSMVPGDAEPACTGLDTVPYQTCRQDLFDARQTNYRELAAVLLGADG